MRVLVAEDTATDRQLICAYLERQGHEVVSAADGAEAVRLRMERNPDLILMDVTMPLMDGYAAAREIRDQEAGDWIPIVFLSARTSPDDILQGIQAGGDDYLPKPFDEKVLRAKLAAMERIAHMRQRLLAVSGDLARANSELKRLVDVDGLTGLANRRFLDRQLISEVARGARHRWPMAVMMADIDHFKDFNDAFGHLAGDDCLRRVAAVLAATARRPADLAARYGGEEFSLLLPETGLRPAREIAERVRREVHDMRIPGSPGKATPWVTLSIGVAVVTPTSSTDPQRLMECADQVLYRAKASGRNRVEAQDCSAPD